VILSPRRTRLTPTMFATFGIAVIWTTGMPSFSMPMAIVDPQRVLDPQVDVRMAASMPLFFISAPISTPISAQRRATVALPEVEKKLL
jgi:hypothetical protein